MEILGATQKSALKWDSLCILATAEIDDRWKVKICRCTNAKYCGVGQYIPFEMKARNSVLGTLE